MPHIRDLRVPNPFVLPVPADGAYYLFGSTWRLPGCTTTSFHSYRSRDLESWDGPHPAFVAPPGFWADRDFWAPEVHALGGAFYMLANFTAPGRYRGTQVLRADAPGGPYLPISDGPVTPPHWECLDGTLHVDAQGEPWIVFCHEWVQIHNGSMCAMRLSADLSRAVDRPVYLFSATDGAWVLPISKPGEDPAHPFACYVTDAPFVHRTASGGLLMLWSSFGAGGYTLGLARSDDGTVTGRWEQVAEPIWTADGGHGMLFRTFEDRLMLCMHAPHSNGQWRTLLMPVEETDGGLKLTAGA